MTPSFEDLKSVSLRLQEFSIHHALGGSGLLFVLGMPIAVNDWDLTIDAGVSRGELERVLSGYAPSFVGPNPPYQSRYLCTVQMPGAKIEIIAGFAIESADGVIEVRTVVSGRHDGVPLGCPKEWLKAYAAMQSTEKVRWLARFVQSQEEAKGYVGSASSAGVPWGS